MVRYLGERARREHLINLVPVQASADAVNFPEPVDVALVVDTYHHIGNRTQYFAKLKSSLRPAGRLVIADFKAEFTERPARPASDLAGKGHARAQCRWLRARGHASVPAEAILPNLREPAVASSCRSTPGSYRCRGYMCIPTTLNHTRAP